MVRELVTDYRSSNKASRGCHLSNWPSSACLLLCSSHNGLLGAPATCQTCFPLRALVLCLWCSLGVPRWLAFLNLKLHCLHPLVLPPDCLIALVNIWHITCSIYLLFISPQECRFHENTNIWGLFSLSNAVFQCLEQCLEHRERLSKCLLNELKKIGEGRDSQRSYFKVSLSRIRQGAGTRHTSRSRFLLTETRLCLPIPSQGNLPRKEEMVSVDENGQRWKQIVFLSIKYLCPLIGIKM